jgi:hypothetical protein
MARLVFTQDYFPGTKDANGQFMGGTEAIWLAGHEGKLFAAIGYGQDRPGTDPKPGAQVLRKDAPDAPWVVDHGFEPNCMRVEGLICGYDGGAGPGHNTAWIYKGTLKEKP